MEEYVNRAERARALVRPTIPEELCISLPIPVFWKDALVDGFFVFSISTVTMTPYPADDFRLVLEDGTVICDDSIFPLSQVEFDTSNDVRPTDWLDAYTRAYANYEDAFNELRAGQPQEHCAAYVRAVCDATMKSQMPYYQLMCPELFGPHEGE